MKAHAPHLTSTTVAQQVWSSHPLSSWTAQLLVRPHRCPLSCGVDIVGLILLLGLSPELPLPSRPHNPLHLQGLWALREHLKTWYNGHSTPPGFSPLLWGSVPQGLFVIEKLVFVSLGSWAWSGECLTPEGLVIIQLLAWSCCWLG